MKIRHHPYRPLIKNVAFFGDAEVKESDLVYRDAYAVAEILAKQGLVIVNGGGPGVMNASTQGAKAAGGETISVTFHPQSAPGFEGRYVGNITSREFRTTNYIERMFKLLEHSDLFIVFKGGTGTVSELGAAWVLAKLYYGHHKPLILFGEFWYPVIEAIKHNLNISREELDVFTIVKKREGVLPAIQHFEWKLEQIDHTKCRVCAEKAFMT